MILVTGGTGFLGAYIIKNLVQKGLPVRAIRRAASRLPFYIDPTLLNQVEWVEGDVLDVLSLEDAMQGVEAVIHSAAVVSFSKKNRKEMYQVNREGTANVVNIALDQTIQRFVHISSVAALGRTTRSETVTENRKWEETSSNTHYALSKHEAEMHVWRGFAEGLEGVILNPSTILGYGDWHQSSCAIFRNAYQEFPWYTKGVNGFVGVEDVAEAAVRALQSDIHQKRFIVNADNWPFQRLFDTLSDHFHKKRPYREATPLLGEIAWRLEAVKAAVTGKKPLLTRETAKVAHSQTSFDNSAILNALPGFQFTPLDTVIRNSCENYLKALAAGEITL
ncbi:MAG TPA: NAD-dependent epimerase/dehydratase family protein [Flavisolibacter sp.]|jgi:nucleoside-diphosphate-sugar epimerase|nr:NAD-dependent epimerase/dehydratase family protein [Flavisolibacter sp.]